MARTQGQDDAGKAGGESRGEYDIFLSHASPDKAWVVSLGERVEALGLRVFVDALAIDPGDNWVVRLSDALERSRYLVLVLSSATADRPWVIQEWTSFVAGHGPLGRLLPVKIDAVDLPFILNATQAIDATHRDPQQVADSLFAVVGDLATLGPDDARRLVLGRDLVFTLSRDDDTLTVVTPSEEPRQMPLPWKQSAEFGVAHLSFSRLYQTPVMENRDRADLFRHARTLGDLLFKALFDADAAVVLDGLLRPGRPRPVVQIRSDDDLLLSLPWELLYHQDAFLVRDAKIDLLRTTPTQVAGETLLREPTEPFKLVVNVSAPEGSGLRYEAESYRITLAMAERCPMAPTELGTVEDLVETVHREAPTGIHFSGHGGPGVLLFEDDLGYDDEVAVEAVLDALRQHLPDGRRIPPFFYLASCHGNEPTVPEEEKPGAPSAAVQLHQAGVTEVVGYFGPIVDQLSTRAEEALYDAIAEGLPTRDAIRRARRALANPFYDPDGRYRPGAIRSAAEQAVVTDLPANTHPFAWSQLVFYRRGPEWPLSMPAQPGKRVTTQALQRVFEGVGDRRMLSTGFIGRRSEQHKIRRRIREGQRVFVFQGLGGLGKSTLAQQVLPWLAESKTDICVLWCQEVEQVASQAEGLVGQLLEWCRKRFKGRWEDVVQQIDHVAGDDSAQRFSSFLQATVQNAPGLVLYLDNLESLLVGPEDDAGAACFAEWAEPALEALWRQADQMARDSDKLYLVASCRYRNKAFGDALLPVSRLPADALFRLTEWFPALRRLTAHSRERLVSRLDGHPRAVEYANDLVAYTLTTWDTSSGEWSLPVPPGPEDIRQEWDQVVAPALPEVAEQLKENLLLQAIWERVLDERDRRFLYRMTVLRRPVEWPILGLLGEPDESEECALAGAERLRDTSLLEQLEVLVRVGTDRIAVTHYNLHPTTARFIEDAHGESSDLRLDAHRRLGDRLEAVVKDSPYIETQIEAGHHLFEARLYDRASVLLVRASGWLQRHGRVREGLRVVQPFLADSVRTRMDYKLLGRLLGTVGSAYASLSEVAKAIGYYEQALVFARETGDRESEGNSLGGFGVVYASLSEFEKAIGYYEQQLAITREIGDRVGEGNGLGNLGVAYASMGEVEKAIGYHVLQLVVTREIGDRGGEGNGLGHLGNAYYRLREFEKAIGYYERQLVITREIGERGNEGSALSGLGNAYFGLDEIEKAIGYHEDALAISRETGHRRGEGSDLGNLGLAYASLDEVGKAIWYHEQQLVIAREVGDRQGEGNALGSLGNAYALQGEVEKARVLLQQAKTIGEQIGDPRIVQAATQVLARLSGN